MSQPLTRDELNSAQKEVVDQTAKLIHDYQTTEMEEADAVEAVGYENFRRELEGTSIEPGTIEGEDLKGYLRAGILDAQINPDANSIDALEESGIVDSEAETVRYTDARGEDLKEYAEDGLLDLQINAVWLPGHIEKLEENNMYDFSFDTLITGENGQVEKAVYGDEDSFRSNMDHGGGLRFEHSESIEEERSPVERVNVPSTDAPSNKKIEEMLNDFLYEATPVDEETNQEEFRKNFDPLDIAQPFKTSGRRLSLLGENKMTETEYNVPDIVHGLAKHQARETGDLDGEIKEEGAVTPEKFYENNESDEYTTDELGLIYKAAAADIEISVDNAAEAVSYLVEVTQETLEDYNSLVEDKERVANELESLFEDYKALNNAFDDQADEIERLEDELERKDGRIMDLTEDKRDLKDQVDQLGEEIESAYKDAVGDMGEIGESLRGLRETVRKETERLEERQNPGLSEKTQKLIEEIDETTDEVNKKIGNFDEEDEGDGEDEE